MDESTRTCVLEPFFTTKPFAGEFTAVGGVTWDQGAVPVRSLVHWGTPEDGRLRVRLVLAVPTEEGHVEVVEHHLRPREILGD